MFKDKRKLKMYQSSWVNDRRRAFFVDKRCEVCGSSDNLQLSRLEPGLSLRGMWSWSEPRRAAVIAECRVLCHEHGKEAAARKRAARVLHGTETRYMEYACRCPACVKAASKARQERRQR